MQSGKQIQHADGKNRSSISSQLSRMNWRLSMQAFNIPDHNSYAAQDRWALWQIQSCISHPNHPQPPGMILPAAQKNVVLCDRKQTASRTVTLQENGSWEARNTTNGLTWGWYKFWPINLWQFIPSVLWHSCLGDRKGIQTIEYFAPAITTDSFLGNPWSPGLT